MFGQVLGPDGSSLDHGYLTFFRAPRSYTGEDTAEITIHGSPYLLGRLLDAAVGAGARPAEPGEFTYRAFRSGRLDLAQAEAVQDLIAARTSEQARVAFEQLEGALARRLSGPRAGLVDLIARLEASLEFDDEDDTRVPRPEILGALAEIRGPLVELEGSFARGRRLREGATVSLAGVTNVGKSSLYNRLIGEDRAIVTEIPGTTRDLLAEAVEIGGIPVRLVDTAGLAPLGMLGAGPLGDPIEAEGIRRAEEARRGADLVLFVLDRSRAVTQEEARMMEELPPGAVRVLNKADLEEQVDELPGAIVVSALTGEGIDLLRSAIVERLGGGLDGGDVPLTRARQIAEVRACIEAIERAVVVAEEGGGEELILVDLDEARSALGRLTGAIDGEEIYDRIFSTFCIGK